ncbi:MAG: nitrate reductase molybdenum cofactor assembly chaperone [Planctomycetes bacterium]|nr:nitrate reductase molybdenum cofactor assembly chaperone [Planctomycetota bacterium]
MNDRIPAPVLEALARLLSYPTGTYVEAAELLYIALPPDSREAKEAVAAFGSYIESLSVHELEETFSRTFDINPACALEIGWHLFGEEYARGLLLVRLRSELRRHGIEETAELPDHVVHVLALLAAMNGDEAERFVRACVQPAVVKMQLALEKADSPYRHVIQVLTLLLERAFGRAAPEESAGRGAPEGDPLRDFPLTCGPPESVEFVPLRMHYHPPGDHHG